MHVVLRYIQALITQMAQNAARNLHHSLEQRLCRWLLLRVQRHGDNQLTATHERIAQMLGVRREGVSEVAGRLRAGGIIQCQRGHIRVLDRTGRRQRSCECYGVLKNEHDRLLTDCAVSLVGQAAPPGWQVARCAQAADEVVAIDPGIPMLHSTTSGRSSRTQRPARHEPHRGPSNLRAAQPRGTALAQLPGA